MLILKFIDVFVIQIGGHNLQI